MGEWAGEAGELVGGWVGIRTRPCDYIYCWDRPLWLSQAVWTGDKGHKQTALIDSSSSRAVALRPWSGQERGP